jgi:6-pyruvoyltetrahydropterin/6-carboxytetrahydropterin synthase
MSYPHPRILYGITKTYEHSVGLSVAFRQWRATHSHCRFLHGYAIQVTLDFCTYDVKEDGWVVDYGGLKEVKQWLVDNFDHKTLVASTDPELETFKNLHELGVIDLKIIPEIGTENFARYIMGYVDEWLANDPKYAERVRLRKVEVREHGGNSAYVERSAI